MRRAPISIVLPVHGERAAGVFGLARALAFVACVLGSSWRAARAEDPRLAAMIVVALAPCCIGVLDFTRWVRGRTTLWDALQPALLVLLPMLRLPPGRTGMLLFLCASAASRTQTRRAGSSCARRRWTWSRVKARACWSSLSSAKLVGATTAGGLPCRLEQGTGK